MGVIMNTNYRVGIRGATTVGWPLLPAAYDQIAAMAGELRDAGFSAVLLAPFTKGSAGQYSAGYDMFDPYDIGSKPQPYGIARTAFGTAEQLRRCIAVLGAHGMQSYGDMVLHQYLGGDRDGNYTPLGSDGKTRNGRFPKTDACFVGAPPRVAVDDVPDSTGNFAFGDMAAYQHSLPTGYMHDQSIKMAQWLTATTGVAGWRIDDAKGTNAAVVHDILMAPGLLGVVLAVAEYFDGDPQALANYVWHYEQGRAQVLDFQFKFNVGNICNNNSRVWMGQLSDIGYCQRDASHAVTFIESADSDTSAGQQTVWNKMLGYAIMLTFPGYPSVYYRDWSDDPGCYGLKRHINNLVWIHEHLAGGDLVVRLDTDPQVFVHERLGWGAQAGCLCAFNNNQYEAYTRTVDTNFGAFQQLHEFTGNGSVNDHWTDGQGRLTFNVPRNNNGMSYLVFARPLEVPGFAPKPRTTTQTFFGAADLDIPPLPSAGTLLIGRVWAAAGTPLVAAFTPDEDTWGNNVSIILSVLDPAGAVLTAGSYDDQGEATQDVRVSKIVTTGWHTLQVVTTGLPAAGSDFALRMTYTGGAL